MSDEFDYEDVYELEKDLALKGYKTPQQIMEHNFDVVYNRNWKEYLKSIEWDGLWLRHDTEEEKETKRIQRELNSHPFKKFI